MEEYSRNSMKSINKELWDDHAHYGFLLPNLIYRQKDDSYYFKCKKYIRVFEDIVYEAKLNIYQTFGSLKIRVKEGDIFKNYTVFYQMCREERHDGIICIVGINNDLFLNKEELKVLGKCLEMHILRINFENNYTSNIYNIHNILKKIKEENNSVSNEYFEDMNYVISMKMQDRINLIDSIKNKKLLI